MFEAQPSLKMYRKTQNVKIRTQRNINSFQKTYLPVTTLLIHRKTV